MPRHLYQQPLESLTQPAARAALRCPILEHDRGLAKIVATAAYVEERGGDAGGSLTHPIVPDVVVWNPWISKARR